MHQNSCLSTQISWEGPPPCMGSNDLLNNRNQWRKSEADHGRGHTGLYFGPPPASRVPRKSRKSWWAGGGGGTPTLFPPQFSRHKVGVPIVHQKPLWQAPKKRGGGRNRKKGRHPRKSRKSRKSWWAGDPFFRLNIFAQFSRHRVGVPIVHHKPFWQAKNTKHTHKKGPQRRRTYKKGHHFN